MLVAAAAAMDGLGTGGFCWNFLDIIMILFVALAPRFMAEYVEERRRDMLAVEGSLPP